MLKTLGLANRARKIVLGTEFTVEDIKNGNVHLVFLASNASDLTKKKVTDKANFYQVKVINTVTSEELSSALGKSGLMVVGIKDKGFAKLLLDKKGSESK